ncbi:MAG: lipopolysaccharide kinase InaA family protein [Gemmatimonadaceae bacterium]
MTEPATSFNPRNGDAPIPGYSRRQLNGAELVAHDSIIEGLSGVIARYGTLYAWARSVTQPLALRGRAPVYVAPVPGALSTTLVVRHAWHGGLFAALTRDVFTRPTRAPTELRVSRALLSANVGTPELLAYALYNAGPGVVRFDVASRYIPDSYDFAVVLSVLSPAITRADAFDAIVPLMQRLAEHGFTHPDLNVKNVLLSDVSRNTVASVLDVDVMEQHAQKSSVEVMEINANRLVRSMRKSRRQFGVRITDGEIEMFRDRLMAAVN